MEPVLHPNSSETNTPDFLRICACAWSHDSNAPKTPEVRAAIIAGIGKPSKEKPVFDNDKDKKIIELINQGKPSDEIKALLRTGSSRIARIRRAMGVKMQTRQRDSQKDFEVRYQKAKTMIAQGATRRQIQLATRISDKSIQKAKRELEDEAERAAY